ncbi:1-acylglycerol-3-phosphate O-acyltransferase [Spizellomyces punctatus DAOM BR117]|uniref:1-acylglycerol-3-phosphate O-acyltransferase n=1 Tax=Spizellomyces punctatus (strain DAOM BR117) TaxID=645134 RepID=A0A0L0H6S1_SPIPD|nr:1-acylglycerol-3-phosphate O-acyltransferase [Spizellomyces punctatus DAOM BR117]KNC96433.1 1-acylglycerol-3-phosphate O-acyltransferase [Spizellomyces punctatus DAOM BR117]|eukprot:XP_016604473.1 1-acylglycerol-3-phosphate O-acyltransferase [Spizellomyces punctatus DAOM BR117]
MRTSLSRLERSSGFHCQMSAMETPVQKRELGDRTLLAGKHKANWVYWVISKWVDFAMSTYYRETFVTGLENLPTDRGCIVAANHWNMAVDIGALIQSCPRKVHFWTKAELFMGPPGVKRFMQAMGCLPVNRNSRSGKKESNEDLFEATIETLLKGGVIAIFPEGTSHHTSHLTELKDGAAWAALQFAAAINETTAVAPVVPVGITYEPNKHHWRTFVHVRYGQPVDVASFVAEFKEEPRAAVKKLTAKLQTSLESVTINAPSWHTLELASKARSIVLGREAATRDVKVINSILKLLDGSDPIATTAHAKLKSYSEHLKMLQVTDEDVETMATPHVPSLVCECLYHLFVSALAMVAIFPSFMVHLPSLLVVGLLSSRETFEESKAQVQIFAAHAVVPSTYAAWYYFCRKRFGVNGWASAIWVYLTLVGLGVLYLRLEDIRREAFTRLARSWRLLRVCAKGKGTRQLRILTERRVEVRESFLRLLKDGL